MHYEEVDQSTISSDSGSLFIDSLDEIGAEFQDGSLLKIENNSIIDNNNNNKHWVTGFIGGKLDHSVHRMFK